MKKKKKNPKSNDEEELKRFINEEKFDLVYNKMSKIQNKLNSDKREFFITKEIEKSKKKF